MTNYSGNDFAIVLPLFGDTYSQGFSANYSFFISGLNNSEPSEDKLSPIRKKVYYKMRGYYSAGSTYETYISIDIPSTNPPSGHILTDIVVVSTWRI